MEEQRIVNLRNEATGNIEILLTVRERLSHESKKMIQVAEYRAFPYMSMIVIDDMMFVGSYLFGERCPNVPMFRIIKKHEGLFDIYNGHFERLWDSAKKLTKIEE